MSKVKVKKIKVNVGMKDEGIAEMFNQMLGTGNVNLSIAYPRYKRIESICKQLVKLFEIVASSPFLVKNTEFSKECEQINKFCSSANNQIKELFSVDLRDYEWNLTLVEPELQKLFNDSYTVMKKDNLINTFIVMCDRIVLYKKNFENVNEFKPRFITSMPGVEWCPFPFTGLNLKQVFSMIDLSKANNTSNFFMTVLHKSFNFSRQLYDELQSPDVDVDQFVEIIMSNIEEIQKRPELSRCREAFNKIKDSVKLLKNNFGGYYKDFIGTSDSTIMMQHFIIDVSKNTEADALIASQFRKIIAYYRKLSQEQSTNPKVKMLFDKVNESFKELDKKSENIIADKNGVGDNNIDTNVEDGTTNTPNDSNMIMLSSVAKSVYDLQIDEVNSMSNENTTTATTTTVGEYIRSRGLTVTGVIGDEKVLDAPVGEVFDMTCDRENPKKKLPRK